MREAIGAVFCFGGQRACRCLIVAAWLGLCPGARAFTPPKDIAGPLTVAIRDPGEVKALEQPVAVPVTITNACDKPVSGKLRMWVTDEWRVEGRAEQTFFVAAKGSAEIPFRVVAGKGTHAALYPVHAEAAFCDGEGIERKAHPILIVSVTGDALAAMQPALRELPVMRAPKRGPMRLDALVASSRAAVSVRGREEPPMATGWRGSDEKTGGSFLVSVADRGGQRRALSIHPPYRTGWGELLLDWRVALPKAGPVALDFATAIRDHDAKREGASDGVQFEVHVGEGGKFRKVFERFSAAKQWEAARVDLSALAGREVTLRLVTGSGPAHNSSCDACFWGEPTLWVGPAAAVEGAEARGARRAAALEAARGAARGGGSDWSWRIESDAGVTGAAVAPGPQGIVDAWIAFSDAKREVVFEGFDIEVGGVPVGGGGRGLVCDKVAAKFEGGEGEVRQEVFVGDAAIPVRARLWVEKGALRVAFGMPGIERDRRGEPRFTALSIGRASEKARRVYAGFGNVLQEPGDLSIRGGGFMLSTRHAGADYANGLSLVQASDVFPDEWRVSDEARRCSLVTHHDATFSFVPSVRGAFAAARVYRGIAGFKPGGGVGKLLGRMCLDQWSGDYRAAAEDVESAGRYGLNDAVFVKHVWQRWGYDYRLPEIYPPAGNLEDFRAMADACRRHGILFAPHDNYIDFYPDAEGFSYKHIIFNPDGAPQKAWLNEGRDAQSYRWLPTAFFPWMEKNLALLKSGCPPTGYFVDVFSAMPPVDFYDREGRFYPKNVTAERWGAAFDRIRETFDGAPTISEAGQDGLIGHLDAGEADHNGWNPGLERWGWRFPAGDGERVPWHDMASHGAFILFAGGLGPRYAGEGADQFLHGYGSDDYLCTTVLGGRNPMCDGPFSRRAVMTYWLLQGVCAELGRREMTGHEFAGDDIHRQITRFADGGIVHANRGRGDWEADGRVLPAYGFVARAGAHTAEVARRDGVVCGFAQGPGMLFADARPSTAEEEPVAAARVLGFEDLGGGKFRLRMEWDVVRAAVQGARIFAHFIDESQKKHEGLIFQGNVRMDAARLQKPGKHEAVCEAALPAGKVPAGIGLRCGIYVPGPGGERLRMAGPVDGGRRVRCGRVIVEGTNAAVRKLRWEAEDDEDFRLREARINTAGRVVNFGPVASNGAFRLRHGGAAWSLIPLPSSMPFTVELRLDRLGGKGRKVREVGVTGGDGKALGAVAFRQEGDVCRFEADGKAFGYEMRFSE